MRVPVVVSRGGAALHPAWVVAAVTFLTILGAAGFRSTPGVLIDPLQDEFGWSRGDHLAPRSRSTSCCSA